jgi:hypothetical protein
MLSRALQVQRLKMLGMMPAKALSTGNNKVEKVMQYE